MCRWECVGGSVWVVCVHVWVVNVCMCGWGVCGWEICGGESVGGMCACVGGECVHGGWEVWGSVHV